MYTGIIKVYGIYIILHVAENILLDWNNIFT